MDKDIVFTALGGARVIGGNFFQLKGKSVDLRALYLDVGLPLFDAKAAGPKALNLDLFRLAREPLVACRQLRDQGHLPSGTGLFLDEEPKTVAAIVITSVPFGNSLLTASPFSLSVWL